MKGYRKDSRGFFVCIIISFFIYVMSNGQWSIPVLAWVYPILFLHLLHSDNSKKTYFIIIGIYVIGFMIQFANVIGMSFGICIVVASLLAILRILPYLFWMKSNMNFQDTIIFPATMVLIEYSICLIYPILGGLSDAYTQYQNSYLVQIVTVTGIYGITFIMYWTAVIILWIWNKKSRLKQIRKYIFVYCMIIGLVFLYGIIVFQFGKSQEKSVRIAGVTVPVSHLLNEDKDVYSVFYTNSFTNETMVHAKSKLSKIVDELFRKTAMEAQAGAKLVFWSELNGAVLKEEEAELLKKASELAKEQKIYFMVSLLVKTPYENLKENKIVTFNPQGEQISEYFKYGRSIGELCQKGDGKLKSFDTEYGRIAPFICSDMAFLSTIRQAGKKSVDILIVPSSDWKEMTLIASKTAVIRGIENGCNVVRHTNQGMSIVSDVRGNILGISDYFKSDTKTLVTQVLTNGRFTLYSYIGNLFVYLCGIYLIGWFLFQSKNLFNR